MVAPIQKTEIRKISCDVKIIDLQPVSLLGRAAANWEHVQRSRWLREEEPQNQKQLRCTRAELHFS